MKQWHWAVVGVLALSGLARLIQGDESDGADSIPKTIASAPAKPSAPEPCAGHAFVQQAAELALCSEVGALSGTIELRDASGASLGAVQAGARIKLVAAEKIRREPGHVDALVCVLSGERTGTVAYARNTHFFVVGPGGPCAQ